MTSVLSQTVSRQAIDINIKFSFSIYKYFPFQGINHSEGNVWRFIAHMASPLQYLHSQHPPVIHRDFKPDNILGMWAGNGKTVWKIADFGVARVLSQNAYGEYYARTDIGTPIYMAPEALRVCTAYFIFK